MHFVARTVGYPCVEGLHQQGALATFKPAWGSGDSLDDVGMSTFGTLVPTAIGRFAHRLALIFVDVLGALGVVGDKIPGLLFEVVADLIELHTGAWHDDIATGLSKAR